MGQNFLDCDREQGFLLPPSLRDWLPEDHLVWFVIDAVGRMDLSAFYSAYRSDGHGRAAYEPSMMVALVLYGYASNERSSRGIERCCRQDIAYRVITGNQTPDHATVARFIRRHQESLNGLFGAVLRLCARAGLVDCGVVAVDGTKLTANAASDSNVDYDRIAREIIEDAIAVDEAEDAQFGEARGDELPPQLRTAAGRRAWLERELAGQRPDGDDDGPEVPHAEATAEAFDPERIGPRGRRGWVREALRQLERQRWETAAPIPRSRAERLRLAAGALQDELAAEDRGSHAYALWRLERMAGGRTKPWMPPEIPEGEVNVTDPDSRRMKGNRRFIQGYNAQAVVSEQQIVLAAEITTIPNDFSLLAPMITAALDELEHADIHDRPEVVLADAQYWNEQHMDHLIADHGMQVLIPPDGGNRDGERPGWTGGRYAFMRAVLATEPGKQLYCKRQTSIEPVFGHTKHNRKIYRFNYRGRSLVRTEWRLTMLTHNLQKLHRHQIATALG
ncbi:MAG TPA: transposase, partial [Solirubrobacteraceae bacterium]|jgi:transposase|nr:transposase [Solirubrobacteraceae bacterium]